MTGDFLVDNGGVVVFFKSRVVSVWFSTESAITARAVNAAAAELIVEIAMVDRDFELGRNFGDLSTRHLLVATLVEASDATT